MFRDTLLESSSSGRKRNRWPMTLAFTLELLVGVALIILPLLSTGVIPVSARVSTPIAPLGQPHATRQPAGDPSNGGVAVVQQVALDPTRHCFSCKPVDPSENDDGEAQPFTIGSRDGARVPDLDFRPTRDVPTQEQPPKRIRVSVIEEGQLLNKVEPVYPRIAIVSGVKGEVRLHAIIAKDGKIQSLTVVSGHPVLVAAARDAVMQWRYRPYLLNGEPVEVETFITVSFKGTRD